jgi:hypothetical protein
MTTPAPENRTQSSLPVPRDGVLVLLLVAVVLGVGSWWSVGGVCGVYHDDAIYVITAKALADGEGYRLINLPDQPYQTKYPILVPSVLALVWLLWPTFPDNLVAMQGWGTGTRCAIGTFRAGLRPPRHCCLPRRRCLCTTDH